MGLDYSAIENDTFDLNQVAFEKIKSIGSNEIISFRKITQILGVNFHISRKQTFQILKDWERRRWIKIHPYTGIKILK